MVPRCLASAARQLLKNPGFAIVVVLTLAVGIGANTAIFSLVNDVLLRELPVKDPDELVLFRNVEGKGGRMSVAGENNGSIDPVTRRPASTSFSLLTLERFRANHPGLSDVFAFAPLTQVYLLIDGQPETRSLGQFVSGEYYAGLGVSAILGRTITAADDQVSAESVAVISYRFWEDRFSRDPAILGQTIRLNTVPVTVVGVTPPGFAGTMQVGESADISVPLALHGRFQPERLANRDRPWYWWIRIMGRLAPGASAAQARAGLEPIFQQAAREGWRAGQASRVSEGRDTPEISTLAADPGGRGEADRRRLYARSLRLLMGCAILLLLAAGANVANLLLARGGARRREIALRLALGAGRARIVRQLFGESLLLASLGAGLGVVFAQWGRALLLGLRQFGGAPAVLDLPLDGRVLGFTVAVTVVVAVSFGLAPAFRATRVDLTEEFRGGARLLGAGSRSRLRQVLMVVQIALSLVLLVAAGLFARTLRNLEHVDPGFDARHLVLFRLDGAAARYPRERLASLHTRVQERLAQIPGVSAATFSRVPLLAGTRSNRRISMAGYTPAPGTSMTINVNGLAPDFFEAMAIPLILGRRFADRDDDTAPRVAIVNQTFARQFFGEANPIGRRFTFGAVPTAGAAEIEIVGLVRDAKYTGLREATPATIYLPAPQMIESVATHYVRTVAGAAGIGQAIRAAVREIDPTLPVTDLRTENEQIQRLNSQERLFARLASAFGAIAGILACVGLYGLTSFLVLRRTGEIGLRLALGARPAQVLRMILRESLALVALGVGFGVALAAGASRFVESMLFGLSPVDPLTYGAVALTLATVALLASLRPAHRASRVDPMTALRAE